MINLHQRRRYYRPHPQQEPRRPRGTGVIKPSRGKQRSTREGHNRDGKASLKQEQNSVDLVRDWSVICLTGSNTAPAATKPNMVRVHSNEFEPTHLSYIDIDFVAKPVHVSGSGSGSTGHVPEGADHKDRRNEAWPCTPSAASFFQPGYLIAATFAGLRHDTPVSAAGSATTQHGYRNSLFEFAEIDSLKLLRFDLASADKSKRVRGALDYVQYAQVITEGSTVRLSDSTTIMFSTLLHRNYQFSL